MDFKLPDLGEGIHEGRILHVHVVEGQAICEDEVLMEVETDKAAVEIPSPCTGTVVTVHVKDSQLVHVGDVMITFEKSDVTPSMSSEPEPQQVHTKTEEHVQTKIQNGAAVRSSPSVRKLSRTLGIDITTVLGTGSGGRVTRKDVEDAATQETVVVEAPVETTRIVPVNQPTLKIEQAIEGVQENDEYEICEPCFYRLND